MATWIVGSRIGAGAHTTSERAVSWRPSILETPNRLALTRDVEQLLTERGVEVDHVPVCRWVLRFTPLLADAARPCRQGVGDRWQVDET
jgi:transposase-like protein